MCNRLRQDCVKLPVNLARFGRAGNVNSLQIKWLTDFTPACRQAGMGTERSGLICTIRRTCSKDCIFIFMKNLISGLFFLLACQYLLAADSLIVNSPDKKISVTVHYKGQLSYSVEYLGNTILLQSVIDLQLQNGKKLSDDLHVTKRAVRSFDEKIISPVPEKRKEIPDVYNELLLQFRGPFSLLLRVYDD